MSRGTTRERQVRPLLEADGYWTMRAAGSLGVADIIGIRLRPLGGSDVVLVEVKSDVISPWQNFRREQRELLISVAVRIGATPWLVWWPPRRQPQWIAVSEWPVTREAA